MKKKLSEAEYMIEAERKLERRLRILFNAFHWF